MVTCPPIAVQLALSESLIDTPPDIHHCFLLCFKLSDPLQRGDLAYSTCWGPEDSSEDLRLDQDWFWFSWDFAWTFPKEKELCYNHNDLGRGEDGTNDMHQNNN